jgi:hypothetical protein
MSHMDVELLMRDLFSTHLCLCFQDLVSVCVIHTLGVRAFCNEHPATMLQQCIVRSKHTVFRPCHRRPPHNQT